MKSITDKYWKIPCPYIPGDTQKKMAREFGIAPEIIHLLANRGICEDEQLRKYLYPTLHDLDDPLTMKGMQEACSIMYRAAVTGGEILIWGDYDVDGVTATSLLARFFKMLNMRYRWFIPDRFTDGYGLNTRHIQRLVEEISPEKMVLVTVDCGIANLEEVLFAKKLGCQVIITDHHEPGDKAVNADAILNPKQRNCEFANKHLAGVGIAFYLAMGMRAFFKEQGYFKGKNNIPNIKDLLELVAIGTIADMASLQGGNRVLVKAGFEVINTSPSPGVAALLTASDIHSANITAEDIAFQLAPKINAAGRLDQASKAVALFLTDDPRQAELQAKKLTVLNQKRKDQCSECLELTLSMIPEPPYDSLSCTLLRVEHSIGVLGIVASQIVEKTQRPAILVADAEDRKWGTVLKGSARSISGVNIYELLSKCSDLLLQYGGHPMAAGITMRPEKLGELEKRLSQEIAGVCQSPPEAAPIDLEMDLEHVLQRSMIEQLQLLEPFGIGNEKPLFLDKKIILQDIKLIGKNGDHLRLTKRGRFENKPCIAFKFGRFVDTLRQRPHFDMIYTFSLSRFRKAEQWQGRLVDLL